MSIYTRTGDDGSTGLADGSRVSKAFGCVSAYGDVDELNAVVGVLRAEALPADSEQWLEQMQAALLAVGAYLADPARFFALPPTVVDPAWLEQWIDAMEAELPRLHHFVLPAGCRGAALAHHARTVCRRAERQVVALHDSGAQVATVLPFLNRLSDALFVLARWLNRRAHLSDVLWHPRA